MTYDLELDRNISDDTGWTGGFVGSVSYLLSTISLCISAVCTPPIQKVDLLRNRSVSVPVSSAGVPPRNVGAREGIDTIHTLNYPN